MVTNAPPAAPSHQKADVRGWCVGFVGVAGWTATLGEAIAECLVF
jgi:hypothetical protein